MDDFKPNSHKYKESQKEKSAERKPVEKVVTGKVQIKKKNGIQKLTDVFISEDASKVKSFVLMDVLIPAVKKAISDIVTNGVDMILYGETGRSRRTSSAGRISYSKYYDDRRDDRRYEPISRTSYDFNDVILESRGEAEEVLSRMDEILDCYGMVSVSDFYDLVGVTGNYTDVKYGWTNLRDASVVHVRDGYIIKFPRVKPLQ